MPELDPEFDMRTKFLTDLPPSLPNSLFLAGLQLQITNCLNITLQLAHSLARIGINSREVLWVVARPQSAICI